MSYHSRTLLAIALALGLLGFHEVAWAQDPIHKMGRGVVNILTGWLELPKQIQLGSQEDNPLSGFGRGLLKGTTLTLLRGGVGLYETITFPLPYPKDFASPYEQMELNDYAWE
ncbi:MAG: exosortase system-associated protein, TIGR04073 family [Candidatus Omnitrophica bacterium]|nr:exosortase system-associated protein, TIGR04073 family [Candidatus Omnitrophota bacterium]